MSPSNDRILPAVAAALARDLGASMQEIASAAEIGRTTLHRRFATRQELTEAVAAYALGEFDRLFAASGAEDDQVPAREALDRLAGEVLPLALAYALLWADPPITPRAQVEDEVEARDTRFAEFASRGQREGCFRPDVPARWIAYSIGAQAVALGWAVEQGHVGAREAERLFHTTVFDGLGGRPSEGGASAAGGVA